MPNSTLYLIISLDAMYKWKFPLLLFLIMNHLGRNLLLNVRNICILTAKKWRLAFSSRLKSTIYTLNSRPVKTTNTRNLKTYHAKKQEAFLFFLLSVTIMSYYYQRFWIQKAMFFRQFDLLNKYVPRRI